MQRGTRGCYTPWEKAWEAWAAPLLPGCVACATLGCGDGCTGARERGTATGRARRQLRVTRATLGIYSAARILRHVAGIQQQQRDRTGAPRARHVCQLVARWSALQQLLPVPHVLCCYVSPAAVLMHRFYVWGFHPDSSHLQYDTFGRQVVPLVGPVTLCQLLVCLGKLYVRSGEPAVQLVKGAL